MIHICQMPNTEIIDLGGFLQKIMKKDLLHIHQYKNLYQKFIHPKNQSFLYGWCGQTILLVTNQRILATMQQFNMQSEKIEKRQSEEDRKDEITIKELILNQDLLL